MLKFVRGLVVGAVAMGLPVMVSAQAAPPQPPSPKIEALTGMAFVQIRAHHNDARIETEFASMANGAFVQTSLSSSTSYEPAKWAIVPVEGQNVVMLVNRYSGRCLDAPDVVSIGGSLLQYQCHGGASQRFTVTPRSPGWYTLSPQLKSNMVIQVANCSSAAGMHIIYSWYDNKACAEFRFEPL